MRKPILIIIILLTGTCVSYAQQTRQALSKTAQNGALYDAQITDDGSLSIDYGCMMKKEQAFVNYKFDSKLKLIKEEESTEPKIKEIDKPMLKYEYIYTTVGGCSSFDVLSMDLNVSKISVTKTWNNKKQYYDTDFKELKISSGKDGKFKYKGYVGYYDAVSGSNLLLVKENDKSKEDAAQYKLITISLNSEVTEIPIGELGKYTLVFSSLIKKNPEVADVYDEKNLAEYNALFLFAPFKTCSADPKDFIMLITDGAGKEISKSTIKMPLTASTIIEMQQVGNELYFFGLTSAGTGSHYRYEFMDFSNIPNPCYPDFYNYRDNQREMDVAKCEVSNLILMKIKGDKLEYLTTTPASALQSKKVVPPSVKKVPKSEFSRFSIQAFDVLDNGDMVVAGQRKVIINMGGTSKWAYEEVTCFHFDKNGNLRAEYCIEPQLATAKQDKIFPMTQVFIVSGDKSSVYWIMYEPEGISGYANFWAAYNGRKTIYAAYQPEVTKINLETAKIGDPELPLGKEFLVYAKCPLIMKANSSEGIFMGQDRKGDFLGLTLFDFR
ncbi:MAG: hypothetical protein FD166_1285 [Bacteroidetes bacterium]|nr:MAG: hypothetical protein FD166_1285 [Bacteroidota bacterium]